MTREWFLFTEAGGLLVACVAFTIYAAKRNARRSREEWYGDVMVLGVLATIAALVFFFYTCTELASILPSGKPATTAPHEGQGGK